MPRLSKIGAAALAAFGWTGISSVTVSYLVVAGGGGGGKYWGGGGGAGGLLTGTASLNPTLSYTVTVGAGGAAASVTGPGVQGSSSIFSTITATGGGYGNGSTSGTAPGGSGGSGGGSGGASSSAGGAGNTPSTSPSQGNNGGTGGGNSAGAGGGGAGAVGTNSSSNVAGAGGAGTASSISGASVTYAGGGGGSAATLGAGGSGGGGSGATDSVPATFGTANTGGGGGGGSQPQIAGSGGSGIVIISYVGAQQFGGGNVTSVGGNTIHTFTTSGTLSPATPLTAQYLIVAGGASGGRGGAGNAGGGGAGGLLTGTGLTIDTNSNYVVTVGAGGAGITSANVVGLNGGNSSFSAYATAAVGGGGGGAYNNLAALSGGSGGGGGQTAQPGAAGTSGQGNAGGASASSGYGGGGGGGAGAVGSPSYGTNGANGGAGGAGTASSISGTSTYYAGGGGGSSHSSGTGPTGGAGGNGGGGTGSYAAGSYAATSGTANTGGGGGGEGEASVTSGAGGSGVVIISYPGATQQMAGGTVTISGGNVIHTFTSSGYLTPIKFASRSLRFRSSASAYLNRTNSTPTSGSTFTVSFWVKRGTLGANQTLMSGTRPGNFDRIYLTNTDTLIYQWNDGSSNLLYLETTQVFRDPSAWYHIVVVTNTTQATSSNRAAIYINGVQVTAFSTATYPSQNATSYLNASGVAVNLGRTITGTFYLDGYLTEVNFVDGAALTPSSFGTFNSYGVWQPITYGGSYGTNGFYLPFTQNTTSTYGGTFNGSSQYLTVPASSLFAPGTGDFTIEAWVSTASATNGQLVWSQTVSGTNYFLFAVDASSQVAALVATTSGGGTGITSGANFVVGSWNHIAAVRQSGIVTVYCNGIGGTPTSNTMDINNTSYVPTIARYTHTGSLYFNGVISNLRYVKGTAVYTSNFTPPTSPLTAISGTSFLSLQNATIIDNSTNALTITNNGSVVTTVQYPFNVGSSVGKDQSPMNNNWTQNNISLITGATYDSVTDVPTLTSATVANYAVLNPLFGTSGTLASANLQVSGSGVGNTQRLSTISVSSGKWYCEITMTTLTTADPRIGFSNILDASAVSQYPGQSATSYAIYTYSPNSFTQKYNNASATNTNATPFAQGDILGIAIDLDSGKIWFAKNNTWVDSGSPSAGTNPAYTGLSGTFAAALHSSGSGSSATLSANFGQQPFTYTPPSGFVALNTYNLSTPTIPNGATQFAATTYTGNGSTQTITNTVNGTFFQPDLVWVKVRSSAATHGLIDSVRGAGIALASNLVDAERNNGTGAGGDVIAFNSNGFNLGNNTTGSATNSNLSGSTYIGWQWKVNGGSTVTNTSGSITSTVSANTTAGFAVVTWTGGGSAGTIGHGLGVTPGMIIIKNRSGTQFWFVNHASISTTQNLYLNDTAAVQSDGIFTSRGATTFGVGTGVAGLATNYVAYAFTPIAGFSAFGSYTGNGSADGPFVYTGFRPRWVLIKNTGQANDWFVMDSSMNTYNVVGEYLFPNTSAASSTNSWIDFLSNGFKIRSTATGNNNNGIVQIYAAFAENPFKYSNAR